jgi:hypothetical protein
MKLSTLIAASILAALSALPVLAQSTVTTSIDVPNASFESPSSPIQTSNSPSVLSGWVFDVQDGSEYGSMTFRSANFSSAGAATGNNYAFINNDYPGVTDTLTSAASLATIAPLTTYTLTVAIGNRNGTGLYDDPGNVSFSLLANGVAFATQEVTNGTVPNGTFEDFTLTYETPASSSIIGDDLTIQLATLPEEGTAFQAGFDNVTLDETTVEAAPEPATALLLVMGGIALLGFTRLRRLNSAPIMAGLTAFSFIAVGTASASADPVDVPNASFELSGPIQISDNPDLAPGWVFNVQDGSAFGINTVSSQFSSPGTSTGDNYAFIYNETPDIANTITTAASLGAITADTTYTLTVAIGNPAGSGLDDDTYDAYFGLLANGNPFVIDPIAIGSVPDGTFQDFTFSFTTPVDANYAGQSLGIVLASEAPTDAGLQAAFDNVTLDETAVDAAPEPAILILLVMGGIAFIGFTRLRRFNLAPFTAGLAIVSFIAAGMASASADPVDVPDNSFETGGGWTYSVPDIVPGWIFDAPTGSSYGSLFQGACFTTPDASEGNQFAFIDNNVAGTEASLTSASTLGTITADTTYTLTVALGSPDAVFQGGPLDFDPVSGVPPAGASLALLANGQPFAIDSIPSGSVASGTWQDFSLTYTTTDSDPIVGEQLTIQLGTDLNPGEAEEASFDNVQLDATANDDASDGGDGNGDGSGSDLGTTPEPSTWALLGIGLAALGFLTRWRRARRDCFL